MAASSLFCRKYLLQRLQVSHRLSRKDSRICKRIAARRVAKAGRTEGNLALLERLHFLGVKFKISKGGRPIRRGVLNSVAANPVEQSKTVRRRKKAGKLEARPSKITKVVVHEGKNRLLGWRLSSSLFRRSSLFNQPAPLPLKFFQLFRSIVRHAAARLFNCRKNGGNYFLRMFIYFFIFNVLLPQPGFWCL